MRLSYGDTHILRGIDLTLHTGETLALLGPSGCGKTTLLRLVAGLLAPTAGEVRIGGHLMADAATMLPPERRGLGMVFQDYALWPHMTVAENVAFPLDMRKVPRAARATRVRAALDRVGLGALADRSPAALSGGQQQRVAIARAIVAEPRIVLFDEPLSNLDRELRETMVDELGTLIRTLGLTAIYVTHDQSEALTLADRVAVMDAGTIAQLAPPEELIEAPASVKVADFLRLGTVIDMQRRDGRWLSAGRDFAIHGPDWPAARVLVTARAPRVTDPATAPLTATVVSVHYRDTAYSVAVTLDGGTRPQTLSLSSTVRMRPGERIGLDILSDRLRWFPAGDTCTSSIQGPVS